jgi:DNA-binding transcriptional regulator YiaG
MSKNFPRKAKTFKERPVSHAEHKSRVAAALRRRLYPNTGITRKQLAGLVGVTVETVENWLSGYTDPKGYWLMRLIAVLDVGFANEVAEPHGAMVVKLSDAKRVEAARRYEAAREELLEGVA